MKLHEYRNYAEYVAAQCDGFKKKKDKVWASEENIKFLAAYLTPFTPNHGLCHGTRGGWEQNWFIRYLPGCWVLGTEICEATAKRTIQWDFNRRNPKWIKHFDFLYSNSFDHAYDPAATLEVWAEQLRPGGLLILEWSKKHEHTGAVSKKNNAMDPVSITFDELVKSVPTWVPGTKIKDVLDMPIVRKGWQKSIIIEVK